MSTFPMEGHGSHCLFPFGRGVFGFCWRVVKRVVTSVAICQRETTVSVALCCRSLTSGASACRDLPSGWCSNFVSRVCWISLRERGPDQKNVFPRDAAPRRAVGASRDFLRCASVTSTLRALPRALPVGSGAVPYGACPRKNPFSLVSAHLLVDSANSAATERPA